MSLFHTEISIYFFIQVITNNKTSHSSIQISFDQLMLTIACHLSSHIVLTVNITYMQSLTAWISVNDGHAWPRSNLISMAFTFMCFSILGEGKSRKSIHNHQIYKLFFSFFSLPGECLYSWISPTLESMLWYWHKS